MNKSKALGKLNNQKQPQKKKSFKWRSMVALALMFVVVFFQMEWVWGILFLVWVIPDLISGTTYFVEEVNKKENPIEYWLIVGTWIVSSIYSISTLFTA